MLKGWADLNIAKPSWCFEVMMIHFMPAALATRTISRASKAVGLKFFASAM